MDILTPGEMRVRLLQHIRKHYRFQTRAAKDWGVQDQYLSAVLHGRNPPSDKILNAVGFERVVVYKRIDK